MTCGHRLQYGDSQKQMAVREGDMVKVGINGDGRRGDLGWSVYYAVCR